MEHDGRVVTVQDRGYGLAMLALVIAVGALVLAWVAYNRTGTNLEDRIAEQVQRATDSVERGVDNGFDGVDDGRE